MQSLCQRSLSYRRTAKILNGSCLPYWQMKAELYIHCAKRHILLFLTEVGHWGNKKGTVYVNFWFILTPWATRWPLGYVHWQIYPSFCGIGLQNRLLPVVQLDPAALTFKRSSFMTWAVCWLWGEVYKISYVSFFGPIWTLKWSSTYCGTWTSNLRNYKWVILHPELSADCVCMGDNCCMIAFIFI